MYPLSSYMSLFCILIIFWLLLWVSIFLITLSGIGTILIGGAKGRVDMTGNAGTIRLILAERNAIEPKIDVNVYFSSEKIRKKQDMEEKKPDLVWKISTNPPKVKYSDLNQDTFLKCLIQVCNGQ